MPLLLCQDISHACRSFAYPVRHLWSSCDNTAVPLNVEAIPEHARLQADAILAAG